MNTPEVRTTLFDEENNMTYHVMAFRKLSEVEMIQMVKLYLSQPQFRKRKTPLQNQTITIQAATGMLPGL